MYVNMYRLIYVFSDMHRSFRYSCYIFRYSTIYVYVRYTYKIIEIILQYLKGPNRNFIELILFRSSR